MATEFEVSDMDVVRAALFDALASGLVLSDVCEAARHADCVDCFMEAVSLIGIGGIDPSDWHVIFVNGQN